LRQEGRGIGLLKKLQAYNLQDQGMDTVDANIHLGHLPDERDYSVAALILNDFNIDSIRLLTNNPRKIDELKRLGIQIQERVAIEPDYHHDNIIYLKAKAEKMSHLLSFANDRDGPLPKDLNFIWPFIQQLGLKKNQSDKPFVTLNVNKIDASIVENTDTLKSLPDDLALNLKHALRAHHDAVLVDINTVLAEDPKLNVLGYDQNSAPQPVILDNQLSFPEHAALLRASTKRPIIYTSKKALADNKDGKVSRLMQLGVRFITADEISVGQIDLTTVLASLAGLNIKTILVENSSELMTEFLNQALADYCIVTMPATIAEDLKAIEALCQPVFKTSNYDCQQQLLATIAYGAL
jgi:3,4-dihydroxy 2-butanone 4-phosphate synthase/GTP cyclohydrolase II